MESRLVNNVPFSEYLSSPLYGSSDIRNMYESFAYWKWKKSQPQEEKRAFVVGSTTHLMLEAVMTEQFSRLHNEIKVYKDGSSLTKGFKAFSAENKGILCVDEVEYELCQRMASAVMQEPEAMSYLKGAIVEPTIFGLYPGTQVAMKARPDYLHIDRGVTINFKTTNDASDNGFTKSVAEYAYDWQSGIHTDLVGAHFNRHFDEVHILVEKAEDGPCRVNILTIDDDTMQWAHSQYTQIIQRIPECEESGVWPKRLVYLKSVNIPLWARRIVELR